MHRILFVTGIVLLLVAARGPAQSKEQKAPAKKLPPQLEKLLGLTPEEFIRRFDKDMDGKLSKDELPPFLAKGFAQADRNGDGKLDREEVAAWLVVLRKVMAAGPGQGSLGKTPDEVVDNLLRLMDANKDGKISRDEAKGKIAENFDKIDLNKDGFLDRKELRIVAERVLKAQAGVPTGAAPYDFDSLDKNADGRLTPDELKGTPWADRFAEIDTDGNGTIDRREFEAFLKKQRKD